jgi:hypothetical protein
MSVLRQTAVVTGVRGRRGSLGRGRFGMNRRDLMKLTSLAVLPMMSGVAMTRSTVKGHP